MAATAEGKINKWGNSAAVRLPADVMKLARLRLGEGVVFEATSAGLLIKSAGRRAIPSLAEMLAACDASAPRSAESEAWINGAAVGRESI